MKLNAPEVVYGITAARMGVAIVVLESILRLRKLSTFRRLRESPWRPWGVGVLLITYVAWDFLRYPILGYSYFWAELPA